MSIPESPTTRKRGNAIALISPIRISQKTCEATIGIHSRVYLESLSAYAASGGAVTHYRRLRLVEPVAYVDWLATVELAQLEAVNDVEALAAELGLSAIGGAG